MTHRFAPLSIAFTGLLALAAPAHAQDAPRAGFAVTAEWLHANAVDIGRDALTSVGGHLSYDRPGGLHAELGYLRAARPDNTTEGLSAGVGYNFTRGRFTVRPGVALFAGVAESALISDGNGHRGASLGAGASLAAEFRLAAGLSATASARYLRLSGDVLDADRTRLLSGFGLSLRPAALVAALRGPKTHASAE